jgi:hypothetical protein
MGTDVNEEVWFSDFSTCLEYSQKLQAQNTHQRVAGDKVFIKAYCVPKKKE